MVTPPTQEPLSLSDANAFLRLQPVGVDTDADAYVSTLITTVRQLIEVTILRRAFLTQTWNLFLRTWPGRDYVNAARYSATVNEYLEVNHITVPLPPLQIVNSFSYITSAGVTLNVSPFDPPVSTLTQYAVNVFKNVYPAKLVLPFSGVWPTEILMPGPAITINFTCGYQLLTDTSPPSGKTILNQVEWFGPMIQAMKMIIADAYENRVPAPDIHNREVMNVAEKLLMGYRIFE